MICGLEVSNCSSFYQKGVIEFLPTMILPIPWGLGLGSLILLMVQKIPFPTTRDGHQTLVNNGRYVLPVPQLLTAIAGFLNHQPYGPQASSYFQGQRSGCFQWSAWVGELSVIKTYFGWAKNFPKDNDKDGRSLNILIFLFFCWPIRCWYFDTLKTKFLIFWKFRCCVLLVRLNFPPKTSMNLCRG